MSGNTFDEEMYQFDVSTGGCEVQGGDAGEALRRRVGAPGEQQLHDL